MICEKVNFDWDYDWFVDQPYSEEPTSCIKHQVDEMKDIHDRHGGFPRTYGPKNTMIHQLWYDRNQIDYDKLGEQLQMEVVTVSTVKQPPGQVIPFHRDTFFQIKKRYPDDKRTMVRANMFLQDWKMGHFMQFENDVVVKWKAGDGYLVDSTNEHLGANAGFEPKYTLQVSGFLQR